MKFVELVASPWAVTPDMGSVLLGIWDMHLRGERPDAESLAARIGGAPDNARRAMEVTPSGVAIIQMAGIIMPKGSLMTAVSGAVSPQVIGEQLAQAEADPRVKATLLVIDSPGGAIPGVQSLGDQVAAATKPTWVYSPGQLCSAAYWTAAGADWIVIGDDTCMSGSCGCIGTHVDTSAADAARGVKRTVFRSGILKARPMDGEAIDDPGAQAAQGQVDHIAGVFLNHVAKHRGLTGDALAQVAQAGVYMGKSGIAAGLVDGIASFEATLAELSGGAVTARTPPRLVAAAKPSTPRDIRAEAERMVAADRAAGRHSISLEAAIAILSSQVSA